MARRLVVPSAPNESAGNRARSVGGSGPGGGDRRYALDTSLADTSAGFGNLAAFVQQIGYERDQVRGVEAETRNQVWAQGEIDKLDPLATDYQDRVKAIGAEAKRKTLEESGVSNSAVVDDLTKRADRFAGALQITSMGVQKKANQDEGARVYMAAADATAAKIRSDPRNAQLYLDEFAADAARLKAAMDPTKFNFYAEKFAETVTTARVLGMAEKGDISGARKALSDERGGLSNQQFSALSNQIDAKESKGRADAARFSAQQTAKMLVDIDDMASGVKPVDWSMREKIEEAKNKGLWANNPEGYVATVRQFNNMVQKNAVEMQKNNEAVQAYDTGTLKTQEQADRANRVKLGGELSYGVVAANGTPEQRAMAIRIGVDMASNTGYLPGDMKNLLSNADEITDPSKSKTVAFAAEAADELEAKAPQKLAGVNLRDAGVVNIVRAEAKRLMQEGVPKDQAYAQAAQAHMGKDRITLQQEKDLKDASAAEIKKFEPRVAAETALTSPWERNIPFVTMPEVGVQMGAEYKRVYEQAFIQTQGNAERAKALADKRIQQVFGVSRVGTQGTEQDTYDPMDPEGTLGAKQAPGTVARAGKPYAMAYPPERFLRGADFLTDEQKAKVIDSDVLNGLKDKHGIAPAPSKDAKGLPSYRLWSDARTAEDVRSGAAPTYQVQILRGDLYEPVPTSNGALRYRVPGAEQVQQNPAFQQFNNERIQSDLKAREKEIQSNIIPPDPVAEERARRMKEEGRRIKGGR